jgi:peroxiredoxin
VAQLRSVYDEIKALNTDVIAISFESGYWVQVWLSETKAQFPLYLDPSRQAYQAYGLTRSRWRSWSPKNLWYYAKALQQGRSFHTTDGDIAQLGGDFIVDTQGIVRLAHRSQDPTDRPSITTLLSALRQL